MHVIKSRVISAIKTSNTELHQIKIDRALNIIQIRILIIISLVKIDERKPKILTSY